MGSASAIGSSFERNPPHVIPKVLAKWWAAKPDLFEGVHFPSNPDNLPVVSLTAEVDPEAARAGLSIKRPFALIRGSLLLRAVVVATFLVGAVALTVKFTHIHSYWIGVAAAVSLLGIAVLALKSERGLQFISSFRAAWDRVTLKIITNIAMPSTILGIILTLVGFAGIFTAITGVQIPHLAIPVSIVLSLTLLRTGLHSLAKGVRISRRMQRFRLEMQQNNHLLHIQQNLLDVKDAPLQIGEIKRLNNRLPGPMQMEHLLPKDTPYSKVIDDVSSNSAASYRYRLAVQKLMEGRPELALPTLEIPSRIEGREFVDTDTHRTVEPIDPAMGKKWNDFWHRWMPTLGVIDMAAGQIMLLCGIGAIVLMFVSANKLPPIFQILAKDPGLSFACVFILLANWVNCTRTGWQMLKWPEREARRNAVVSDEQLIDLGVELTHLEACHHWITTQLADADTILPQLQQHYEAYLETLPKDLAEKIRESNLRRREGLMENPSGVIDYIYETGKNIIPYLSTPSMVLGFILFSLGITLLVMSITKDVPAQLKLLAENTPLSILFSTGLIVSGIHATHRGIAMRDQGKKEGWKCKSKDVREWFLHDLTPILADPTCTRAPQTRIITSIEIPVDHDYIYNHHKEVRESCQKILNERVARVEATVLEKSLNLMCLPDALLGTFFLLTSLVGIAICLGAPVPKGFEFVKADPHFSLFFCLTLIGIAVDALQTTWRMLTYHRRKEEDRVRLEALQSSYGAFSLTHAPNNHILEVI